MNQIQMQSFCAFTSCFVSFGELDSLTYLPLLTILILGVKNMCICDQGMTEDAFPRLVVADCGPR